MKMSIETYRKIKLLCIEEFCMVDIFLENLSYELQRNEDVEDVRDGYIITSHYRAIAINEII